MDSGFLRRGSPGYFRLFFRKIIKMRNYGPTQDHALCASGGFAYGYVFYIVHVIQYQCQTEYLHVLMVRTCDHAWLWYQTSSRRARRYGTAIRSCSCRSQHGYRSSRTTSDSQSRTDRLQVSKTRFYTIIFKIQESIPVGCVQPACQPCMFSWLRHQMSVPVGVTKWTGSQWLPPDVTSRVPGGPMSHVWEVGVSMSHVCGVRSNVSWVMVTRAPPVVTYRHGWKHYIPATMLVGNI